MKRKIIYVQWLDAHNISGWHEMDRSSSRDIGLKAEHVGFLMYEDKDTIRLSAGISDENHNANNTFTIPKGIIRKKVLLGYSEEYGKD